MFLFSLFVFPKFFTSCVFFFVMTKQQKKCLIAYFNQKFVWMYRQNYLKLWNCEFWIFSIFSLGVFSPKFLRFFNFRNFESAIFEYFQFPEFWVRIFIFLLNQFVNIFLIRRKMPIIKRINFFSYKFICSPLKMHFILARKTFSP